MLDASKRFPRIQFRMLDASKRFPRIKLDPYLHDSIRTGKPKETHAYVIVVVVHCPELLHLKEVRKAFK
jgi:hypothetical protein